MIKYCIVCGKEFECYGKFQKSHGGIRINKSKRRSNCITCSHSCSQILTDLRNRNRKSKEQSERMIKKIKRK